MSGTPAKRGLVAGLDIGGTKTLTVVVDGTGTPVVSRRRATGHGGPAAVVASLLAALRDAIDVAGIAAADLDAIGLGLPGIVDPASGAVRHAVNLGIGAEGLDLAAPVEAAFGVPVVVDNDANAAALGAARILRIDDLAYLSIGTGVAVGLVLDGRLRSGRRGAAGEIGHLPVDPDGPVCRCGQRGCLEVVASGSAVERRWPFIDGESPVSALFAAAEGGDPVAIEQRQRFAGHLATAVTVVGLTVDPEAIVLGGGVADVGPPLLAEVGGVLRRRAARSELLADIDLAGRLAAVPDGLSAGALGAVALARAVTVPTGARRS